MVKSLKCVPDDVTLRCGVRSIIQVKTSDDAQGATTKALGYDSTVASLNPTEGKTNNEGYLEVSVTRAQERACPGETTAEYEIDKAADCAGPSVKETLTFTLCHLS